MIVAEIRWPQPYYLQFFFNKLRGLMQRQPHPGVSTLIQRTIDEMIMPGADNDFHHWEERLSIQLCRRDADHALALLDRTAQDRDGGHAGKLFIEFQERLPNSTTDEVRRTFIRLRDILIRDAYWVPDDRSGEMRYRFCLEPLRRWWLRRNTV
jgi:hypothetical protein